MKSIFYLVLKATPEAVHTLDDIRNEGYNATVMSSESLKRAMEELPEERHFFTLRHAERARQEDSIFCLFVVDTDKLEHLKDLVRRHTNNFKSIKGFMFSKPIEDYEGSI